MFYSVEEQGLCMGDECSNCHNSCISQMSTLPYVQPYTFNMSCGIGIIWWLILREQIKQTQFSIMLTYKAMQHFYTILLAIGG